ncbi:MAG: caspase family protein, partial [Deltaproteobacteria bacterium]|nr:caspase family protein [Deltaproteobacteria bacterium]
MLHKLRVISIVSLSLVLVACVSNKQYNRAILQLESAWKETNDRILESEGRRFFKVTKHQGFLAIQSAVRRLGMVVEQQSYDTGFMLVTAPAPVPLTMSDWAVVQQTDTQEMRSIIAEEVGLASWFVTLDPSAKDVLANIFLTEKEEGVEISIGLRLRNRKVETDRSRRMQPPPSAVRMGLRKLWSVLEQELDSVIARGTDSGPEPVVYPFTRNSMSLPKAAIPSASQSRENPNAIAVIIGNKNYRNRIPQVDFAHNDAEAMKRFLNQIIGVIEGNIIDLRDVNLAEMEAVLGNDRTYKAKLWRYVRPRESDVFIFYSGHGVTGLKDGCQYLLPVDGDPNAPEIQGYPAELLYRNLDRLEARSVTVFMDACFSGESMNGPLVRSASGIHVTTKNKPTVPFTVISAASKDQIASWDKEARHGLFTKHLLDALYGAADNKRYGNADNRITLSE